MNLQGKVKSIDYLVYRTTSKGKKIKKESSKCFFNEVGFKTLEVTMDEQDRDVTIRLEYFYDSLGRLATITHYKMTRIDKFKTDTLLQALHRFVYDSLDRQKEEHVFDRDTVLKIKYIYQYNDKGLKTVIDGYDMKADNKRIANYTFQYDERGNATEEMTVLLNASTISYKYSYEYAEYADSTVIGTKYIHRVEGEFESDRTVMYKYDEKATLIEEYWAYGEEGFKYKSTYSFDTNSNWTKRVDEYDKKVQVIAERKLTYY